VGAGEQWDPDERAEADGGSGEDRDAAATAEENDEAVDEEPETGDDGEHEAESTEDETDPTDDETDPTEDEGNEETDGSSVVRAV